MPDQNFLFQIFLWCLTHSYICFHQHTVLTPELCTFLLLSLQTCMSNWSTKQLKLQKSQKMTFMQHTTQNVTVLQSNIIFFWDFCGFNCLMEVITLDILTLSNKPKGFYIDLCCFIKGFSSDWWCHTWTIHTVGIYDLASDQIWRQWD